MSREACHAPHRGEQGVNHDGFQRAALIKQAKCPTEAYETAQEAGALQGDKVVRLLNDPRPTSE
jgi:hypothetical protein